MYNYDFTILHYNEFECFTRDLLQAHEGLQIESFAAGRDKGIDLRFAYDLTKKCIVQCKRYKDWKELKNSLKKEVDKVKLLNPDRYILSTSVDLTAANKDEIQGMFSPYIKRSTDILAKSDLNNLLEQHNNIEQQYYKLWLGSTNVLETILHRDVLNWSEFEKEEIKAEIGKYVFNESFNKASKILHDKRYVIISGIPGIGKTTLARMLVYDLLAHGYDEFVYIAGDLDKACAAYNKERKQVFFFDDFLGANTFKMQGAGFENRLVLFINQIKQSRNSVLILTTREYILSEAKSHYEKIELNNLERAKCTIEMSHYSTDIRAHILYNHLDEADIPVRFINALLKDKGYMRIIKHPNFNPRVIEGFIKGEVWKEIAPADFMNSILNFFDRPLKVWEKAFDNLDKNSRYALLVFATFGDNVLYDDWHTAFQYFCQTTRPKLDLVYDDITWKQTIKILHDCFIKTEESSFGMIVKPFNPSILDFCATCIRENSSTLELLLSSARYLEQLTTLFTDSKNQNTPIANQIEISSNLFHLLRERFSFIINSQNQEEDKRLFNTKQCNSILKKFPIFCRSNKNFIEQHFQLEDLLNYAVSQSERFSLIRELDWNFFNENPLNVLKRIALEEVLDSNDWVLWAQTVKEFGGDELLINEAIISNMKLRFKDEIDSIDSLYFCEDIENALYEIHDLILSWDIRPLLTDINITKEKLEEEEERNTDTSDWYRKYQEENVKIEEMFSSLLEKYPEEERETVVMEITGAKTDFDLDFDCTF